MTCTYDTLTSWRQDSEWWNMLLNAEAGDVVFVDGGRHFAFLGEGRDRLDGIVYSTYKGEYNHSLYAPNEFFALTLQDLFTGNGGIWGGWYRIQDGGITDIHHRTSATVIYPAFEPDTIRRAASHGAASGAVGAATCLPVGAAPGAVVCGAVASATTGVASALLPEFYHLQRGEKLVKSAGHAFVYAVDIGESRDSMGRIYLEAKGQNIRIYGPHVYRLLQELRVRYD